MLKAHIPLDAQNEKRDHLQEQISSLPYFRGLLRAIEARFYENIDLPAPTLDLGCGDGHFASLAFDHPLEVGLDPWRTPLGEAKKRGGYEKVVEAFGDAIPYPAGYFASAVSNSVLEHIPDLDPVLADLARVLRPGAPFIFCVPNHYFLGALSISSFLDRTGLAFAANGYRRFFNRIARHHHCDDPDTWKARLEIAGFELEDWWHYFSPDSLRVLEWGHYFGLPSLLTKKLFDRWVLVPTRWNLIFTNWITKKSYQEPSIQPQGTCTFFIARRR
ncbi:MAG: class I SAM-dependent methyltransferase [Chloroflexi bacterium]|nr:class I SAM-dependent methyltransferase [Chloroflexota bacterium]